MSILSGWLSFFYAVYKVLFLLSWVFFCLVLLRVLSFYCVNSFSLRLHSFFFASPFSLPIFSGFFEEHGGVQGVADIAAARLLFVGEELRDHATAAAAGRVHQADAEAKVCAHCLSLRQRGSDSVCSWLCHPGCSHLSAVPVASLWQREDALSHPLVCASLSILAVPRPA